MAEGLLQKIEERVTTLLAELESLRHEVRHLKHENNFLKNEKASFTQKIQGIISALDAVEVSHPLSIHDADVLHTTNA